MQPREPEKETTCKSGFFFFTFVHNVSGYEISTYPFSGCSNRCKSITLSNPVRWEAIKYK
jgi:hypothetical protein